MEAKRSRCDGQGIENFVRKNLCLIAQQINQNPTVSDPCRRVYECKDCDKKYDTFQALGGHRASHKKVKPNDGDDGSENSSSSTSLQKHECKVCGLEFSIGQALGGHMRRHQGLKLENNSIVEVDEHRKKLRTDKEVEEVAKYPVDKADELQQKKADDDTAGGGNYDNLQTREVSAAPHDTEDEIRQPTEGDKYPLQKVNGARVEVVKNLQDKPQTSGEDEMTDTAKDSTPVVPRKKFKCCDLNLPPEEDDRQNEFQERPYYYFL